MTTQTMRQIVSKYLAPAIIALSLCGTGYTQTKLPVAPETESVLSQIQVKNQVQKRETLNQMVFSYKNALNTAKKQFNEAIVDGQYSQKEQKETFDYLASAKKLAEQAQTYSDENKLGQKVEMPKEFDKLESQLVRSVNGKLFTRNTLEDSLLKQNAHVSVEKDNKLELGNNMATGYLTAVSVIIAGGISTFGCIVYKLAC